jgi:hypothetical protein
VEGELNRRADPGKGEPVKPLIIVKDKYDNDSFRLPGTTRMPTIDPNDLIGRTFLTPANDNGERFKARVVRKILDDPDSEDPSYENVKFILQIDDAIADQIVGYNEVITALNRQLDAELDEDDSQMWKFRQITGHQGPLKPGDPAYKGCAWNVLIEWETGETTYEPLNTIAQDDPMTCAVYAKNNGLLDTPGWRRFKRTARMESRMLRDINKTTTRLVKATVNYKFGFQVPRTFREAVNIDNKNGNTLWKDAVKLELSQINEYQTFEDKGKAVLEGNKVINAPEGYKRIRVHLVYDVKHDGRHKARLVADGHLTQLPTETVYSSVVSLRSLRIVTFLNELNKLELWGADIGNAYLEAYTAEKIYIVGGPEFGDKEGNILVIKRALYGLRSSGRQWHLRLSDCMRDLNFWQCKADSDVWMRRADDDSCYEYVAVYVDDLLISMKQPATFCSTLKDKFGFKLKGDGPISYHLGLNYIRSRMEH